MGGHHTPHPPPVPDWRIYRVEDVPQLVKIQKKLALHGLKNPWLRNEVWRYTEIINTHTKWQRFSYTILTGFKYGAIAAVITAAIEYAFFPIRKAPDYGEHSHH